MRSRRPGGRRAPGRRLHGNARRSRSARRPFSPSPWRDSSSAPTMPIDGQDFRARGAEKPLNRDHPARARARARSRSAPGAPGARREGLVEEELGDESKKDCAPQAENGLSLWTGSVGLAPALRERSRLCRPAFFFVKQVYMAQTLLLNPNANKKRCTVVGFKLPHEGQKGGMQRSGSCVKLSSKYAKKKRSKEAQDGDRTCPTKRTESRRSGLFAPPRERTVGFSPLSFLPTCLFLFSTLCVFFLSFGGGRDGDVHALF